MSLLNQRNLIEKITRFSFRFFNKRILKIKNHFDIINQEIQEEYGMYMDRIQRLEADILDLEYIKKDLISSGFYTLEEMKVKTLEEILTDLRNEINWE